MHKVSIISPCYNSEKYLQQMINSVRAQTYEHWELILINDYSQDKTLDIININLKEDYRIKLIDFESNNGVASARNAGITFASGRYIAFLDSDDLWDKEKLEIQIQFMESRSHLFTYTAYRKIDYNSKILNKHIKVNEFGITYRQLLKHNEIGCLTVIYNADIVGKQLFRDMGHEDFIYWLSILKLGNIAYGINRPLASYRVHKNSISANKLKAAGFTWTIYREVENLPFIVALSNFMHYSITSFIKYIKK